MSSNPDHGPDNTMLATPTTLPEPVLDLRDLLNTYLEPEKVAIILRAFETGAQAQDP